MSTPTEQQFATRAVHAGRQGFVDIGGHAQAIRPETALVVIETPGNPTLALVTPAVSLGSTDTLIQLPAVLTHRVLDADI